MSRPQPEPLLDVLERLLTTNQLDRLGAAFGEVAAVIDEVGHDQGPEARAELVAALNDFGAEGATE